MIHIRLAKEGDVPALQALVEASVRGLGPRRYSSAQIEASMEHLFGVDTQLVADGTYYVAEVKASGASASPDLVGAGGWSRRKTPFGGDQAEAQDGSLRDPATDPAVIRAFFVHPDHTRQGIGERLLSACETAAREAGFRSFELTATLTGHAFYAAHGYVDVEPIEIPLTDTLTLEAIKMRKGALQNDH